METGLSKGVAACFAEQDWQGVSAEELVHRALVNLKSSGLGMATHFDEESALMFHMLRNIACIPVIHIREPEDPPFMHELVRAYAPNLIPIDMRRGENKRTALQRAVYELGLDGVFFGIHGYQSKARAKKALVELDSEGLRSFCRLHATISWKPETVFGYFETHDLPRPRGFVPGTRMQEDECGLHCPVS